MGNSSHSLRTLEARGGEHHWSACLVARALLWGSRQRVDMWPQILNKVVIKKKS